MSKTIEDYMIPGPRGQQGPQGAQGPAGAQGPQGVQGPMGPIGPQGPKGERGCRGPQGERGPKGDAGFPGPKGEKGDCGERGLPGRDGIVAFEELRPEVIAALKGDRGPKGEQGERGIQGMTGPTGARGPAGETGPAGPQGPAGPVGPKGSKGDKGERGFTGPKGEPGGVQLVDHIHDGATWSSKQIADYKLHGKVDWTVQKGENLSVPDTENGYVRNFKIHGRTLTNYANLEKNFELHIDNKPFTDEKNKVDVFSAEKQGVTALTNGSYTLLFNVKHSSQLGEPYAAIKITRTNLQGQEMGTVTTYEGLQADGTVKAFISVDSQHKITDIEVVPFTKKREEQGSVVSVTFVASKFMLIRGDWRNTLTPDYFVGTKGVGINVPNQPNTCKIEVESRGKNLLDLSESKMLTHAYIEKDTSQGSEKPVYRYRESDESKHATFIIYCKPRTGYTLTLDPIIQEKTRIGVIGFQDRPTNGERGENLYYEDRTFQSEMVVHFSTGLATNMLVVYLANFENDHKLKLSDVVKNVQLEEGSDATTYEPYISVKKTFIIPQQIKDDEYLYWKPSRIEGGEQIMGQYYLHVKTGDGTYFDMPTVNDAEELIHTYDGMTYIYVKSRVPSVVEGEFPIKAHTDYYTKEQVNDQLHQQLDTIGAEYFKKEQFIFNDVSEREDLNFLRLPSFSGNSFILQWKEISFSQGPNKTRVEFPSLASVLSIQVTLFKGEPGQNISADELNWMCPLVERVEHAGIPTFEITANAAQSKDIRGYVWVIGRGTRVE